MAFFTANQSINQFQDLAIYITNFTEITSNRIVASTEIGTTLIYEGSFSYAGGTLSGGTITNVTHVLSNGTTWWNASGVSVPVQTYFTYADNNDFIGLQSVFLSGNDVLRGSMSNDLLAGFAGADLIYSNQGYDSAYGYGGNDTIFGGRDDDLLYAGTENDFANGNLGLDIVHGESGNDTLRGGQGNDTLYGGDGNDLLYGDKDNDLLYGGAGVDVFVFGYGRGADVIVDFQDGIDKLHLEGFGLAAFDQLSPLIGTDAGGNALLTFATGELLMLANIAPSMLDAGDIVFI